MTHAGRLVYFGSYFNCLTVTNLMLLTLSDECAQGWKSNFPPGSCLFSSLIFLNCIFFIIIFFFNPKKGENTKYDRWHSIKSLEVLSSSVMLAQNLVQNVWFQCLFFCFYSCRGWIYGKSLSHLWSPAWISWSWTTAESGKLKTD